MCSSPCPCNPAFPSTTCTLPGAVCRFYHPRWPRRLLPVLISGLQSTPKTPTRHAPYEWLIRILTAQCPVRFPPQLNAPSMAAASAGRWRGGVLFPTAKRRIEPIACCFCSFHHCSAGGRAMIRQLPVALCRRASNYHQHEGATFALCGILRRHPIITEASVNLCKEPTIFRRHSTMLVTGKVTNATHTPHRIQSTTERALERGRQHYRSCHSVEVRST